MTEKVKAEDVVGVHVSASTLESVSLYIDLDLADGFRIFALPDDAPRIRNILEPKLAEVVSVFLFELSIEGTKPNNGIKLHRKDEALTKELYRRISAVRRVEARVERVLLGQKTKLGTGHNTITAVIQFDKVPSGFNPTYQYPEDEIEMRAYMGDVVVDAVRNALATALLVYGQDATSKHEFVASTINKILEDRDENNTD